MADINFLEKLLEGVIDYIPSYWSWLGLTVTDNSGAGLPLMLTFVGPIKLFTHPQNDEAG